MSSTIYGSVHHEEALDLKGEARSMARAKQARHAGFVEFEPGDLRIVDGFVADRSGLLFERVAHVVLDSEGARWSDAVGFYRSGDDIAFLVRPIGGKPTTVEELEERKAARARADVAASEARDEAIRAQPRRPLTLADLDDRELPTLRAAVELIERFGAIAAQGDGTLVIELPEHFDERAAALDAARVVFAAKDVVLAELARKSKEPLAARLPGLPVGGGGGVVASG